MKYHTRFKKISPYVQRRTKWLMKRWGLNDQWAYMRAWLVLVSQHYGLKTPVLVQNEFAMTGYYAPTTNEIHMAYPSIITLLHEFRHAMQSQGWEWSAPGGDREYDARAWSLSLYYAVAPKTLRRLVAEGRVLHTTLADFSETQ